MPKRLMDDAKHRNLPLGVLRVSENNARQRDITVDIDDLAASISALGVLQPIVVQQDGRQFEILVGQRRFLAAKQAKLQTIPCLILPTALSELDAKALSYSENVQRTDLTAKDKSDVCAYLLQKLQTVKKVSARLGVSEPTVRKWLKYAGVPDEIKDLVASKQITQQVATRIAQTVPDEDRAVTIAREIAKMQPPVPERERILAAVEEFPDQPFRTVLKRAGEMKTETRVHFVLTDAWYRRLTVAADKLQMDPSEVAQEATKDWLRANRY